MEIKQTDNGVEFTFDIPNTPQVDDFLKAIKKIEKKMNSIRFESNQELENYENIR